MARDKESCLMVETPILVISETSLIVRYVRVLDELTDFIRLTKSINSFLIILFINCSNE